MLGTMLEALRRQYPGLTGRTFVDTAPLLEKQLAVEAGLGWIGRQSLLLTPQYGSYVLLGELVLTLPSDQYDAPFAGARCGRCRNCLDSCPTGAIVAPKVIDTNRCISCRTIEKESDSALPTSTDGSSAAIAARAAVPTTKKPPCTARRISIPCSTR